VLISAPPLARSVAIQQHLEIPKRSHPLWIVGALIRIDLQVVHHRRQLVVAVGHGILQHQQLHRGEVQDDGSDLHESVAFGLDQSTRERGDLVGSPVRISRTETLGWFVPHPSPCNGSDLSHRSR